MIVRFSTKEARLPEDTLHAMEKKVHARLDPYYRNEAADATTVLVKISEKKHFFKMEINMPYGGQLLRTEHEERDNAMPALDKGLDVLERQVKKHKTRMNRNLRESIKDEAAALVEDAAGTEAVAMDDGEEYRVVKVKRYEAKPMSVQDALLQMDLLGHSFFMFHNTETNAVCTAYRRTDGDYGLIELV